MGYSMWDFLMGRPDYDESARGFLDIIENDVKRQDEDLQSDFHKSILEYHIEWLKSEFPKDSEHRVEATHKWCRYRYPKIEI